MSRSTSPLRRRRLAASVIVLALGLGGVAACSESGDDSAGGTTTTVPTDGSTTTTDDDTTTTESEATTTTEDDVTTTTEDDITTTTEDGPDPSPGGDEQAYVDAMVESLESDFDETTTLCVSEGLVAEIGVDRFESAGVSPEDIADGDPFVDLGLDEGTAENLYDVMDDCTGGLLDVILADLDAETADCVKNAVSEEDIRQVFLDLFQGIDGTDGALDDAFMSCMGE